MCECMCGCFSAKNLQNPNISLFVYVMLHILSHLFYFTGFVYYKHAFNMCVPFRLFLSGNSIYQKGFEKACALLKASASEEPNKNKKRVILFLTDGEPSDRNVSLIFKTIRDCNLELNNSVIIFTYGIGTVDMEILIDIAIQNTTKYGFPPDKSLGDITVKYIVYSLIYKAPHSICRHPEQL